MLKRIGQKTRFSNTTIMTKASVGIRIDIYIQIDVDIIINMIRDRTLTIKTIQRERSGCETEIAKC